MTTRARLRARHRKHKRRTYWRKLRRERGYFECGEPLTFTEVICRRREDAISYLEVPPVVVGLGAEIEEARGRINEELFAKGVKAMSDFLLSRMQSPGGPWFKVTK